MLGLGDIAVAQHRQIDICHIDSVDAR